MTTEFVPMNYELSAGMALLCPEQGRFQQNRVACKIDQSLRRRLLHGFPLSSVLVRRHRAAYDETRFSGVRVSLWGAGLAVSRLGGPGAAQAQIQKNTPDRESALLPAAAERGFGSRSVAVWRLRTGKQGRWLAWPICAK